MTLSIFYMKSYSRKELCSQQTTDKGEKQLRKVAHFHKNGFLKMLEIIEHVSVLR